MGHWKPFLIVSVCNLPLSSRIQSFPSLPSLSGAVGKLWAGLGNKPRRAKSVLATSTLSQGTLAGLKHPGLGKGAVTVPAGRGSSLSLVHREPVTTGLCSLLLPSSAACAWFGDLFARCFLFAFQHFVVESPLFIPAASCHRGPPANVWRRTDQSPGDSLTLFCRANSMKLVKPINPLANFSVFLLLARRCGILLAVSNAVGRTRGQLVFNTRLNVKCVLCHQDADNNFPDERGQDQVPANAVVGSSLAALL